MKRQFTKKPVLATTYSSYYGWPDITRDYIDGRGTLHYKGHDFDEAMLEDLVRSNEFGTFDSDVEEFSTYIENNIHDLLDGFIRHYERYGNDGYNVVLQ